MFAALVLVAGCQDPSAVAVPEWTLITADGHAQVVSLPTRVDELVGERGRFFELRATLEPPTEWVGSAVTLAIAKLPARVSLQINGEHVEPSVSELLSGYRSPGDHHWRIPGALFESGEIRLRLVVEDSWFQSTRLGSTPRLSTHRDGDRWYRFVTAFNTFTAAVAFSTAILLGILYLIVFVDDRSRRAYGLVAAMALLASAYPFFMLGASQWMLGVHDLRTVWFVGAAALVSVAYTRAHLELSRPHWVWFAFGAIEVGAGILSGPFSARWTILIVVVGTSITAIYQVGLLATHLLRGRCDGDAVMMLVSWIILAVCSGTDMLYWGGLGGGLEGLHGASLGIGVFVVLQAAVLSRGHGRTMTRTDALNRALLERLDLLEKRDGENRRLTEELTRQVGARSRQLSHALARLSRAPSAEEELSLGVEVDSRYRVVRQLGTGAMAVVYEVERLDDRRRFALKALKSMSDPQLLARFAREAHIAAEVSHENVVAIHDIDFAEAGFMYIIMDLVDGGSLKDHATRYGELSWALEVLRQIVDGLQAIHVRGVVHRDLKPANILLDAGTAVRVRISDFGVSGMTERKLMLAGEGTAHPLATITQLSTRSPPTAPFADASGWDALRYAPDHHRGRCRWFACVHGAGALGGERRRGDPRCLRVRNYRVRAACGGAPV